MASVANGAGEVAKSHILIRKLKKKSTKYYLSTIHKNFKGKSMTTK